MKIQKSAGLWPFLYLTWDSFSKLIYQDVGGKFTASEEILPLAPTN